MKSESGAKSKICSFSSLNDSDTEFGFGIWLKEDFVFVSTDMQRSTDVEWL